MKREAFKKKLSLTKTTIARLNSLELFQVKGGETFTKVPPCIPTTNYNIEDDTLSTEIC